MSDLFLKHTLQEAFENQVQNFSSNSPYDSEIRKDLSKALEKQGQDVVQTTRELGQACPLRQSFTSAAQSALHNQHDIAAAFLDTISAGGDNAQRCSLVGSWLGAALGIEAIPPEFIQRLSQREKIEI